jgi:hypothetical protein
MNAAVSQEKESVAPQSYSVIRLNNTLPQHEYTVETKVESHEVGIIDLAAARKQASTEATKRVPAVQECSDLKTAADALAGLTDERKVPGAIQTLQTARRRAASKDCAEIIFADAVLGRTSRTFSTYLPLEAGQFATATAYRIEDDGKRTQVSQKVFDTGELGTVRTHALFAMHPNHDQRWFTQERDGKFFVTPENNDRRALDPVGAAIFTLYPSSNTAGWSQLIAFRHGAASGSFTVGVGVDEKTPLYLAGYALNFTESFGIAVGVAAFNQQRLKGIYKGDGTDEVKQNLQPDQLMDTTTDRSWFIGITFRR